MDLKTSEGATSEQAASQVALTYREEAKLHSEAGNDELASACEEASRVAVVLHAVYASDRLRRRRRMRLWIAILVIGAVAGLLTVAVLLR